MSAIHNPSSLSAMLLLVIVAALGASTKAFFTPASARLTLPTTRSNLSLLQEAMYPWEGPLRDNKMQQYKQEETLLKLRLKVKPTAGDLTTEVLPTLQKYIQSFAFAAVLPVQPLQYVPTDDGGVEVKFMRKKTKEKGSIDGGLRFWVLEDKARAADGSVDDSESAQHGVEIVVKRNSEGQTCGKMFSEKLVVLAFVQSFTGGDANGEYSNKDPPTNELVSVESMFHKWMEV